MRKILMLMLAVMSISCLRDASAAVTAVPSYATLNGTCTGVGTGPYTIPFVYPDAASLVVSNGTSTLVITTDYTLSRSIATQPNTGTLSLTAASKCPSGGVLTVRRVVTFTQPVSFKTQGTYSPATHEAAFDRLTMLAQQINAGDSALLSTENTWTAKQTFAPTITNKNAIVATGTGTSGGIVGTGGSGGGSGVAGIGNSTADGVTGTSAGSGVGVRGTGGLNGGAGGFFSPNSTSAPIRGNVHYVPLSAAPSTPTEGDSYYDSVAHALYTYNGTAWVSGGAASGVYQPDILAVRRLGQAFQVGPAATTFTWAGLVTQTPGAASTASSSDGDILSVKYTSTATTGQVAGLSATNYDAKYDYKIRWGGVMRTETAGIASRRYTIGTTSAIITWAPPTTAVASAVSQFYLGYDDTVNSGKWLCVTGDATNMSGLDTGVTVAPATVYRIILDGTNWPTSVSCTVNGVTVTKTTNLPLSTYNVYTDFKVETRANAAAVIYVSRYAIEYN